jgi:hypothetical protein
VIGKGTCGAGGDRAEGNIILGLQMLSDNSLCFFGTLACWLPLRPETTAIHICNAHE